MNKLEKAYSEFLGSREDVASHEYETVKLKLRGRRFYLVDFKVLFVDGHVEMHEIKAKHRWYEKGVLKLCYAADMYPEHRFVLVERVKGGWVEEVI